MPYLQTAPYLQTTPRWHATFPSAHVGVLGLSGIDNTRRVQSLDVYKRTLATTLCEQYAGWTRATLLEQPVLEAYKAYYGRFGNTYQVLGQLESVLKGKGLPSVSPLVDAAFAAEMETLVLTAGHDADRISTPLILDALQGDEPFIPMRGDARTLKAGDMMLSDAYGVVCTILGGQDAQTPLTPATRRVLYVTYAPEGVPLSATEAQLAALRRHVQLFAPDAEVEGLEVYRAGEGKC